MNSISVITSPATKETTVTVNQDEVERVVAALLAKGFVVCLAEDAVETKSVSGGFYSFDSVCCQDTVVNTIMEGDTKCDCGAVGCNSDHPPQQGDSCPRCPGALIETHYSERAFCEQCGWSMSQEIDDKPCCQRCSSKLQDDGRCPDETCPYSDRQQGESFTEG